LCGAEKRFFESETGHAGGIPLHHVDSALAQRVACCLTCSTSIGRKLFQAGGDALAQRVAPGHSCYPDIRLQPSQTRCGTIAYGHGRVIASFVGISGQPTEANTSRVLQSLPSVFSCLMGILRKTGETRGSFIP
jgi:hypothetical protein